jgi:hypothetical protein
LDFKSPAKNGKGSEFRVLIPMEAKREDVDSAAVSSEKRKT